MTKSKPVEQYLEHIEAIAGDNGEYFQISDSSESLLAVVSYANVPEQGCLTAFSFGLSSASVVGWTSIRPELVISVDSEDVAWAIAMGELIRNAKGREHVFSWGEILDFRTAISEESEMSAFLCFECTVLAKEDLTVKLADRTIFLSQIYPIYEEEIDFIQSIGVERFFYDLNIDFFDVKRDRVISAA